MHPENNVGIVSVSDHLDSHWLAAYISDLFIIFWLVLRRKKKKKKKQIEENPPRSTE